MAITQGRGGSARPICRRNRPKRESTIGLYKAECIHLDGPWRNVDDVELATMTWVWWFNEHRLHSAIGYVPPVEFENTHYRSINPQQQPLSGEHALH